MIGFKDLEKHQKKQASMTQKENDGSPTNNRTLIITGVILGGALIVGYIVYKKVIVKPQANMNSGMGSNMGGGAAKAASFD